MSCPGRVYEFIGFQTHLYAEPVQMFSFCRLVKFGLSARAPRRVGGAHDVVVFCKLQAHFLVVGPGSREPVVESTPHGLRLEHVGGRTNSHPKSGRLHRQHTFRATVDHSTYDQRMLCIYARLVSRLCQGFGRRRSLYSITVPRVWACTC